MYRKDLEMVTELIASKEFNWKPDIIEADDNSIFVPSYVVYAEAVITPIVFKSKFSDLPSCGMWVDWAESDDELLNKLGSYWSEFGGEQ